MVGSTVLMSVQPIDRFNTRRRQRQLSGNERAAYFARRQVQSLQRRWIRANWRVELLVAGAAVLATGGAWAFVWDPLAPYVIGALVASAGWLIYVFMIQTGGIALKQVGVLAEEWTANELRRLQKRGWRTVNHVMREHCDIDHAVIGPGGVFAIDTKYRWDWTASAAKELDHMAAAAKDGARALSLRIGMRGKGVQPVIAVWTSAVRDRLEKTSEYNGVILCPGRQIRTFLEERPTILSTEEIDARYLALDDYVRTRDRGEREQLGPQPRTIGQMYTDTCCVALTACLGFLLVANLITVEPTGLRPFVAAATVTGAGVLLRRSRPDSVRLRLCTTAAITTAVGLCAALAAGLALSSVLS